MATPIEPPKSLSAALWAQAQHKAFQCLYHPFVASLARGDLARADFQAFLLQDAYFLNAFAQAFAFAATKTRSSHHTLAIVRRMGGIETELRTHSAFLAAFGIDVFEVTDASVAPATRAYVHFLMTTAKRSDSVAEILAAMTPCMRLYAFLGQQIAAAVAHVDKREPNPYQRWIDSYSPAEFNAAAVDAEQHLDELATFEGVAYETLLPLYNRAMELELRFFEQYFPIERAASSFPPATITFPMSIHVHVDQTDDNAVSPWEAPANGKQATDLDTIDLQAVAGLSPGHYEVVVTKNRDNQLTLDISSSAVVKTSLPLYSMFLATASPPSSVIAQNKAELVAFLQAITARGCFETYAQPLVQYSRRVPRVLIIAGSDSGGGAGIQADMKACTNLGVYSASAVAAVTVQNTRGVHGIHAIPVNIIADQITCVLDDIGADVVKIGMLATEEIIEMVATALEHRTLPLVLDPVMVATSGHRLLKEAAHKTLVQKLFPLATIITPNIPETSVLLNDRVIESIADMTRAARDLAAFGPAFVLVKGGHLKNPPGGLVHDVLLDAERDVVHVITNPKLTTRNTHGTGCTLASAIAAQFAKSGDMERAVRSAISYLHGVLLESQALAIGTGDNGPMLHLA